jgi:hypothetical protein
LSPGRNLIARLDGRVPFAALLVVHLAPIWLFTYFPSQDGPIHLYNAKLLFEQLDPANYQVRQLFRLNLGLHPNILTHVVLALLQTVVAPLVAEKILLSALVALLPLALVYFLRALDRADTTFVLVGFLFAYHNLLHVGFYNFSLGVSMCFLALGYWWRHKDAVRLRHVAAFNVLLLATYLSHFAAFAALLIAMTTSVCWSVLLAAWRWTRTRADERSEARARLAARLTSAAAFAGYALPAFAFAADYYLRSAAPQRDRYHSVARLWNTVWQTLALSSYTDWHRSIAQVFLSVLALALVITVVWRVRRREGWLERDAVLVTGMLLTATYFTLPWWKNDGGWVNDRILLFVVLFLSAWVQVPSLVARRIAGVVLIALSLAHIGRLSYEYHVLQPELREFTAATELIRPHSTVAEDIEPSAQTLSDAFAEPVKYVAPFTHVPSYYGLGHDIALHRNYETALPYFLIRPGEADPGQADYVVAWRMDEGTPRFQDYAGAYDLIFSNRHLKLFQLKAVAPDTSSWGETDDGHPVLRLGMGWGREGTTWHEVGRETLHVPGKHGWIGLAPTQEWPTAQVAGNFTSAFADERDRTFRISLPNGSYRVTCAFAPAPNGDYEVNVIANDRQVGRHVEVRRGQGLRTLGYDVQIADAHLTQTFYSTWSRSTDLTREVFWALSGISVERR